MAAQVIAKVLSLQGIVQVRDPNGTVHNLMVGDALLEGQVVLAGAGGHAVIGFVGGGTASIDPGQAVAVTAELSTQHFPTAHEAQIANAASAEAASKAILSGADIDKILAGEATAAGGPQNEAHTFVQLLRISEAVVFPTEATTAGVQPLPETPIFHQLIDQAPQAVADTAAVHVDNTINIPVLINDHDPDGDPISIVGITQGQHGSVAIDPATNGLVYTPAQGYLGPDTFTYTISDGRGGTGSASVSVDVYNHPPVAVPDTGAVNAGSAVTSTAPGVTGNDTDADNDPLTVTAVNGTAGEVGTPVAGTYGHLILNPDGSYSYSADSAAAAALPRGDTATDTFTYTVDDGHGGSATTTLTVTITGIEHPPVANPDVNTVTAGQVVSSAAPGVTGNDTDLDHDPLVVSAVNGNAGGVGQPVQGTYGELTLNPDGSYSYTADTGAANLIPHNQTATDTFTYTVDDGHGGTASTTLTITIDGADHQPTLAGLTQQAQGGDVTVHESNLPAGSAPNNAALTQTGSFTVTSIDGVQAVQIGGTTFITGGAVVPGASLTTPDGNILHVTGYNPTTGSGSV